MSPSPDRFIQFWQELKRRRVIAHTWYEDYLGSDLLSDDPRFNNLQKKIGLEN